MPDYFLTDDGYIIDDNLGFGLLLDPQETTAGTNIYFRLSLNADTGSPILPRSSFTNGGATLFFAADKFLTGVPSIQVIRPNGTSYFANPPDVFVGDVLFKQAPGNIPLLANKYVVYIGYDSEFILAGYWQIKVFINSVFKGMVRFLLPL